MGENLVLALFVLTMAASGAACVLFVRRPERRGIAGVVLGNCLVLLFLLSLVATIGEIYCRFWRDTTDSLNYTKASVRWFERHWKTNAEGCRDNLNYEPRIEPGKRRISLVGDSFTAAQGVKNIEDRFGNLIRQANPGWEIHLLAKAGFDTGNEVDFLRICVANGYQLDLVVLVYCLNDVSDLMPEWDRGREALGRSLASSGWLRRNSFFIDLLYHRLQARRNPYINKYFDFVRQGYEGEVWEKQKRRLEIFQRLVAANGGRLAVVTFPFFQTLGPNYEYRPIHEKLQRFWDEHSVPNLDLLPIYSNIPPAKLTVNRFDAHPNEYAHALAAEAIDQFLLRQLRAGPSAQPGTDAVPNGPQLYR